MQAVTDRWQKILHKAKQLDVVSARDIQRAFHIKPEVIRQDFMDMAKAGLGFTIGKGTRIKFTLNSENGDKK